MHLTNICYKSYILYSERGSHREASLEWLIGVLDRVKHRTIISQGLILCRDHVIAARNRLVFFIS